MIIPVENNLDKLLTTQYSYLTTNLASGGTAIPVRNINAFTASYAVQLGKSGEEQSEVLVLGTAAVSGTALNTTGTIRFDHPLDTPIFNIHYNKIIFKRSTSGTAGTATPLTNGTVDITPDSLLTEFLDTSGSASYAYKTQYYNSVTGSMSIESDWFIPTGASFHSLGKLRQRTKDALYNANYFKSDQIVNDWINEWVELMTNAAIKVNQGYSLGTAQYAFGTASLGTVTDATFKQPVKVEVTFDGDNYSNSTEIPINRFDSGDTFSSIYPRHYWQGDTVFGILPNGSLGTARITFSKRPTILIDDADELPLSLRSYTTGCIEYALYRAFDNDLKRDYATDHYQKYNTEKNNFITEVTPRDQTGVKTIQLVESLSGMNDDVGLGADYFI